MSNTDKYFEALAVRLQNDAAGLLALSEIMESHMRYSIDPRLSNDFNSALKALFNHFDVDPLTALAAVMREHDLEIYAGDAIINIESSDRVLFSSYEMSHHCVTADDIKPDADNENEKPSETKCFCGRNYIKGATKKMCDHIDCIPH